MLRQLRIASIALVSLASFAAGARAAPLDSDGDGAIDLVEDALGTNPQDPADNPEANGDVAFAVPQEASPSPADATVEAVGRLSSLDLYVIVDRSGSMSAELADLRANLAPALDGLACPPIGSGDPLTCIPDLWAGAGAVGYSESGADTFRNVVDLGPDPDFSALPTDEPAGCCSEPLTFSVWSAITGLGSEQATGCGLDGVPVRTSCSSSPAASQGFETFGYPCFREGAIPVIVLATDEPPLGPGDTNKCPSWNDLVLPGLLDRSARLVGVPGSGAAAATLDDLGAMATDTGAVDATNGNAPIVVDGSNANATTAITSAVETLIAGAPLDLSARIIDDPGDAIDAPGAFVDHLETAQLGTPECADGLTEIDTDADSFPDSYLGAGAGTRACWRIVARPNLTVPALDASQVFAARIEVIADGATTVRTRDVYFVVLPAPEPARAAQLAASLAALAAVAHGRRRRRGWNGRAAGILDPLAQRDR